jgi:hypothetical protein
MLVIVKLHEPFQEDYGWEGGHDLGLTSAALRTRTQCNGLLLGSGIWQTAGLRASCWFGATLWEAMFGTALYNYAQLFLVGK